MPRASTTSSLQSTRQVILRVTVGPDSGMKCSGNAPNKGAAAPSAQDKPQLPVAASSALPPGLWGPRRWDSGSCSEAGPVWSAFSDPACCPRETSHRRALGPKNEKGSGTKFLDEGLCCFCSFNASRCLIVWTLLSRILLWRAA